GFDRRFLRLPGGRGGDGARGGGRAGRRAGPRGVQDLRSSGLLAERQDRRCALRGRGGDGGPGRRGRAGLRGGLWRAPPGGTGGAA
ncbi:MAG: tRNA (guanine(37)-N(1))-methyltransferase, partial [uncultured Rubrobacteraceae bacterium]